QVWFGLSSDTDGLLSTLTKVLVVVTHLNPRHTETARQPECGPREVRLPDPLTTRLVVPRFEVDSLALLGSTIDSVLNIDVPTVLISIASRERNPTCVYRIRRRSVAPSRSVCRARKNQPRNKQCYEHRKDLLHFSPTIVVNQPTR